MGDPAAHLFSIHEVCPVQARKGWGYGSKGVPAIQKAAGPAATRLRQLRSKRGASNSTRLSRTKSTEKREYPMPMRVSASVVVLVLVLAGFGGPALGQDKSAQGAQSA